MGQETDDPAECLLKDTSADCIGFDLLADTAEMPLRLLFCSQLPAASTCVQDSLNLKGFY